MRSLKILSAVKRSQSPSCQRAEKREVEEIDVKMENVELLRALAHLINHQHEVRNDVAHGRIESATILNALRANTPDVIQVPG